VELASACESAKVIRSRVGWEHGKKKSQAEACATLIRAPQNSRQEFHQSELIRPHRAFFRIDM
jgi:hypothetical protein